MAGGMSLMELRRQLDESNLDKRTQYFLAELYEHQLAMSQDLDRAMSVVLELANTVQSFVQLHEQTQGQLKAIANRNKIEGVDVSSVPITDKFDS